MARAARPGRRPTRSARRCRSTIICRTAPTTTAASIASMCRSMLSRRRAPMSRRSAPRKRRPNFERCIAGLAKRTKALLHEGDALAVMVEDRRLSLEISVIVAMADRIADLLIARDPLSENVHIGKAGAAGIALERHAQGHAAPPGAASRRLRRSPVNDVSAQTASDAGSRASGSSFYTAMRIMPREQREAMFEIYSFCRAVDDIADEGGDTPERLEGLQRWRDDIAAIYAGNAPPNLRGLAEAVRTLQSPARGLPRRDRRHGDGCDGDHPRAGSRDARPLLRPRRERGRPAERARVRHGEERRPGAGASSRPRAAAHQHPARPRRGCRHRPALSAEGSAA